MTSPPPKSDASDPNTSKAPVTVVDPVVWTPAKWGTHPHKFRAHAAYNTRVERTKLSTSCALDPTPTIITAVEGNTPQRAFPAGLRSRPADHLLFPSHDARQATCPALAPEKNRTKTLHNTQGEKKQ